MNKCAPSTVTVRMYNVGFGDCFLVRIPGPEREHRILIDCGTHTASKGSHSVDQVVTHLLSEIVDESDGNPAIDVVVATHRHRDHISGFDDERWRDVFVEEVWMPWTEAPDDDRALALRDSQLIARNQILSAHAASADTSALAMAENFAASNDGALATLHTGFKGQRRGGKSVRRFLASTPGTISRACLPDVRIHVLGPSRDPALIRAVDPPEEQHFFDAASGDERQGAAESPFHARYAEVEADLPRALRVSRTEGLRMQRAFVDDASEFAMELESAGNGTSIVLVLEVGQACLLFAGDAQWGTWKAALKASRWRHLLARTNFFKVGHHGSHNATPIELVREVLEADPPRVRWAAVSVAPTAMKSWKNIPRPPLLKALRDLDWRVIRSDGTGNQRSTPGVTRGEDGLYYDFHIPM